MGTPKSLQSLFEKGLVWLPESGREEEFFSGMVQGRLEIDAAKSSSPSASPTLATLVQGNSSGNFELREFYTAHSLLTVQGLLTAQGTLHEWIVCTEPQLPCLSILAFLIGNAATASEKLAFWIGRDAWPTPFLLLRTNLLHGHVRNIFLDPPNEKVKLWCIETALRSQSSLSVVANCTKLSYPVSKRFSFAASRGGAIGFIMRSPKALATSSMAKSRWSITPLPSDQQPRFELKLIRCKGAQPQRRSWIVELKNERGKEHEQISLSLPQDFRDGALHNGETSGEVARDSGPTGVFTTPGSMVNSVHAVRRRVAASA